MATAAAQRRWRQRRKEPQVLWLWLELPRGPLCDFLIERGHLEAWNERDREAIRAGLQAALDRVLSYN